jgi:hypothetical protein
MIDSRNVVYAEITECKEIILGFLPTLQEFADGKSRSAESLEKVLRHLRGKLEFMGLALGNGIENEERQKLRAIGKASAKFTIARLDGKPLPGDPIINLSELVQKGWRSLRIPADECLDIMKANPDISDSVRMLSGSSASGGPINLTVLIAPKAQHLFTQIGN